MLFSADYMAVAHRGKGATRALTHSGNFPVASGNEGALSGYVGLKPEDKGDFSLGVGGTDSTRLLFQLLIESIRIVGN